MLQALPRKIGTAVIIPTGTTLEACADDVLNQVAGHFIVAGTSFGGHVALQVALTAPERVQGLWITGAAANGAADPQAGLARSSTIRAGRQNEIVSAFSGDIVYLQGPDGPTAQGLFIEMGNAAPAERVAAHNDALSKRPDRWRLLPTISCPTLLLWGEHDSFSKPEDGRRMATLIPEGEYHAISDCGHLPSLEHPARVAGIATRWLGATAG
jgi:pimeloyl-ACP methyl ester carboxylesterase